MIRLPHKRDKHWTVGERERERVHERERDTLALHSKSWKRKEGKLSTFQLCFWYWISPPPPTPSLSLSLSLSVSFAHPYAITHTRYFLTYIIASLLFFLYYNCVSDNGTKDRHFFDSHIFSLSQVLNYLSACLHGFYLSPLISPFHISIFILSLCYFLLLILELFLPSVQHSLASIFQC